MLSIIGFFHINIFLIFIILISVTIIIFFKVFFLLLALSFNFYPVDYLDLEFTWLSIGFHLPCSLLYDFLILCYQVLEVWRYSAFSSLIISLIKRFYCSNRGRIQIRSFTFLHLRFGVEEIFQNRDFRKCSCESKRSDWKKLWSIFFNTCFKANILIYSIIKFFIDRVL